MDIFTLRSSVSDNNTRKNKLKSLIKVLGNFLQANQKGFTFFLGGVGLAGIIFLAFLFVSREEKPPIIVEEAEDRVLSENVSPTEVLKIVVEIAGAVNSPGVYELPQESRVKDLIEVASGLSEDVDQDYVAKNFNLAASLSDGQKIYVPKKGEVGEKKIGSVSGTESSIPAGSSSSSQVQLGKININTASVEVLDSLPGIGSVYAQRIIEGRPYSSIEEIQKVQGIGPKTFEKLKDKICVQ